MHVIFVSLLVLFRSLLSFTGEPVYLDIVRTVTDPRFVASTITATSISKLNAEIAETVVPVLNTAGMVEKSITLSGKTYKYFSSADVAKDAVLMLTLAQMRGSIHYGGIKLYIPGHEGEEQFRVYGEPWTGDVFINCDEAVKAYFGICIYIYIYIRIYIL
jgi:hypothetical protein